MHGIMNLEKKTVRMIYVLSWHTQYVEPNRVANGALRDRSRRLYKAFTGLKYHLSSRYKLTCN
jgi:hypothetical protein